MIVQYEIFIIYDKEYGEVIVYETSKYMNDSNDIVSEAISLADTVLVLSKRPATILDSCEMDIDKSLTPLKRREHPAFSKWFEKLWKELNL